MTPASPTWGDVEDFLRADNWTQVPRARRGGSRQSHIFFEKVLPSGRVLQTHISHDRGSNLSPGRFGSVLRNQLEFSRSDCWEAIRTGNEVIRPAPVDDPVETEHPLWVVVVLTEDLHMTPEEIAALGPEEAEAKVHEHWAKPKS